MSKTENIHFKLSPQDKAKIIEGATISKRSLSSYCTYILLKVSEITKYGGTIELEKVLKLNGTTK